MMQLIFSLQECKEEFLSPYRASHDPVKLPQPICGPVGSQFPPLFSSSSVAPSVLLIQSQGLQTQKRRRWISSCFTQNLSEHRRIDRPTGSRAAWPGADIWPGLTPRPLLQTFQVLFLSLERYSCAVHDSEKSVVFVECQNQPDCWTVGPPRVKAAVSQSSVRPVGCQAAVQGTTSAPPHSDGSNVTVHSSCSLWKIFLYDDFGY